jgi:cytochrome c oxidase subunit I+III
MLFVLAFFTTFVVGGLTGVMIASVPLDLQLHDTFFIVAHLHYVLIGGAIFPLFGAVYFWFPKMTGRLLDERLGKLSFALVFVGFHLTFFPMHQLGLSGMPRRVYTYDAASGWGTLNLAATIGAFILGTGALLTVINVVRSLVRGARASDDPWQADGLEWSTSSPPPSFNFAHLPTVRGLYARWTSAPDQPVVTGVRSDRQELLITRVMDAEPDHRWMIAGSSIWPFALALATGFTFIYAIFSPWAVVYGAVPVTAALVAWFWPKEPHRTEMLAEKPS